MNRVCIIKSTGKIIESQGGGKVDRLPREHQRFTSDASYQEYLAECDALEASRLNTLRQNAINAGYAEGDIEVKWVSDEERETIIEADRQSRSTYADKRRAEYPPMADYLDGIVKDDQSQINKYIADCLAVKAKYPKPA